MKQVAILGPTASGKSALAIEWAQRDNAVILSLDSLSIYKEINIVSAKPTLEEQGEILHFGIDEIYPNVDFNVKIFCDLYEKTYEYAQENGKNLIIVGGSSFYLKTLITGLSYKPEISETSLLNTKNMMKNLANSYELIKYNDTLYANKIKSNDSFRIEKWLHIYYETGLSLSEFFKKYPTKSVIKGGLEIYSIEVERELLRSRIRQRTVQMFENGLIDEVKYLEKKYTRVPKAFKSIGIKESFDYIDGKITKNELLEQISNHTAQLAKRQRTFNKHQFENVKLISGQL